MRFILILSISLYPVLFGSFLPEIILRPDQDYALFFAVDDYRYMDDLSRPIENAHAIAAELEGSYGFETEVIENPTIDEIDEAIERYQQRFTAGTYDQQGQLLIYFSGHGVKTPSNGYFMAHDSNPARPNRSALEYDYYRDQIDAIPCQHILVAIDACHSATFDPAFATRTDRRFGRPGEQEFDRVLGNHRSYRTRIFWTSDAEGNETPDRSSFAYRLLEGLRSPGSGDYLRSSFLFSSHLELASPQPGGGRFGRDEPSACFLFFREAHDYDDLEADANAWAIAEAQNTLSAYRGYLSRYPDGDFAGVARSLIRDLEEIEQRQRDLRDWSVARDLNTVAAFEEYLSAHSEGRFKAAAADRILRLKAGSLLDEPVPPSPNTERETPNASDIPDGFVFIPGGTFEMGDVMGDHEQIDETVHTVELSDFYLAAREVTFAEYHAFCEATGREKPSDSGWGRGDRPVINVDWYDCIEYCNWKSGEMGLQAVYTLDKSKQDPGSYDDKKWLVRIHEQANGYRLPTEAEWEYAARQQGQKVRFGNGQNTADPNQINFNASESYKTAYSRVGTYPSKTTPVGSFEPNSLGLYDMSGNVWEWCEDWYGWDYYASSPSRNPTGPNSGVARVIRGGDWSLGPWFLRVANRADFDPGTRNGLIGFRPARSL